MRSMRWLQALVLPVLRETSSSLQPSGQQNEPHENLCMFTTRCDLNVGDFVQSLVTGLLGAEFRVFDNEISGAYVYYTVVSGACV
jgi:hypothetical protein